MSVQAYNGPGQSALSRDAAIRELGGLGQPGQSPLGSIAGEPIPGVPFNSPGLRPKIIFINHSRTQKRTVVKVPVSFRRGARQALAADPSLRKDLTIQGIYDEVKEGRDMSIYEDKIVPVVFSFMHNGRPHYIKPADSADEAAPEHMIVDDGVWDLFMGNYQEMHSPDARVRENARMRLAGLWRLKKNPVFRAVYIDGDEKAVEDVKVDGEVNPFGYIEIRRVLEKEAPTVLDRDFVTALDLVEM